MSVNAFLAATVRRVNARYNKLENPEQVDIFSDRWRELERKVDTAMAAGDEQAAKEAIRAWEYHALLTFTGGDRG